MPHDTPPVVGWLATLSDVARLRILRLLNRDELSVGELARSLQLPQSTVSRHLKVLLEGRWIHRRSEGTASFYRVITDAMEPEARTLWEHTLRQLEQSASFTDDDHRLAEVLSERMTDSRAFFGRVGGEWDHHRSELFGHGFTSEALLSMADPSWVVADLGCGTGNAAEHIAPLVSRVIAVDREPTMVAAARQRLSAFENIEFRAGDLLDLPIEDAEVDLVIIVLVLHHLESPVGAISESARILKPGGIAIIVDTVAHGRELYRQTMGHRHLGFEKADLATWASTCGLHLTRYHRLRPDTSAKGPGLFAATLRKS